MILQKDTLENLKIFTSPYQLCLESGRFLEGVLMSFHFDSQRIGYSDFLPWPSFGEKNLKTELQDIAAKKFSSRFLISCNNAWIDAEARKNKQNLFYGMKIPSNHFLINDLLSFQDEKKVIESDYKRVKVKLLNSSIQDQVDQIKRLDSLFPKYLKWRLDLNGSKWSEWNDLLFFMKDKIDFIEDPFLERSQNDSGFAEDWIYEKSFSIKIAKPSRDSLKNLTKGLASSRFKRVVFTHSFDHPLGQSSALYWACLFYKNHPSFLEISGLKCLSFKESPFYFHQTESPFIDPPKGFGFGFDHLLKDLHWERLV